MVWKKRNGNVLLSAFICAFLLTGSDICSAAQPELEFGSVETQESGFVEKAEISDERAFETDTGEVEISTEEAAESEAEKERSINEEVFTDRDEGVAPEAGYVQGINKDKGCIVSIINEEYLKNIPTVTLIQNTIQDNEALLEVILGLQTVTAQVRLPDGTTETIMLPVEWAIGNLDAPQIDTSVPGAYEERGSILTPEGYTFEDGVLREIVIPVEVRIPEKKQVITSIEPYPQMADAYAFIQGTALEEIKKLCNPAVYWNCYDAFGTAYSAEILWDYSRIDPHKTGVYEVSGQLQPPENTVFSDALLPEKLSFSVSIQEAGKPEVNCCFAGRGRFCFPWVTPPGNLDEITVWISEKDGSWKSYTKESSQVYWDATQLILEETLFTAGKSYYLQVDYDGGKTNILTFIYDQSLYIDSYNEGDRDGGDANGILPDIFISESVKDQEEAGETYDVISGEQIKEILEFSDEVQFSNQGISVSLPQSWVLRADLSDEDILSVEIGRKNRNSFSLVITKNEKQLTYMKDIKLVFPWKPHSDSSIYFLLNEKKLPVSIGNYNSDTGLLIFYVNTEGNYTVFEAAKGTEMLSGIFSAAMLLILQFLIW